MSEDQSGPRSGVITGLSSEVYHSDPAVCASDLSHILRSPAHFYANRMEPRSPSPQMRRGTLLHCAILEPDEFGKRYITEPKDAPRRPMQRQLDAKNPSDETLKAIAFWQEWDAENLKEGVEVCSFDEIEAVQRCADVILKHPIVRAIHDNSKSKIVEASFFGTCPDTGLRIRCRPDMLAFFSDDTSICLDPKSTDDARPSAFMRNVYNYSYFRSVPFYEHVIAACGYKRPDSSILLAFERDAPFGVQAYELDEEARAAGEHSFRHALQLYAEAVNRYGPPSADWPCYNTAPLRISLPAWAN